jgi:hypothetical protein
MENVKWKMDDGRWKMEDVESAESIVQSVLIISSHIIS